VHADVVYCSPVIGLWSFNYTDLPHRIGVSISEFEDTRCLNCYNRIASIRLLLLSQRKPPYYLFFASLKRIILNEVGQKPRKTPLGDGVVDWLINFQKFKTSWTAYCIEIFYSLIITSYTTSTHSYQRILPRHYKKCQKSSHSRLTRSVISTPSPSIPTSLLKRCLSVLFPTLTTMKNICLLAPVSFLINSKPALSFLF